MKAAMAAAWLFGLVFGQAGIAFAAEKPILIVAAENVYGDIARQVGGERVSVVSIMSNPDQDPHLFETTPGIVRQIAAAQIVILNGANYDPWMDKLLTAAPRRERIVLNAARIAGYKAGDNPHIWYDPATMPAVAAANWSSSDPHSPARESPPRPTRRTNARRPSPRAPAGVIPASSRGFRAVLFGPENRSSWLWPDDFSSGKGCSRGPGSRDKTGIGFMADKIKGGFPGFPGECRASLGGPPASGKSPL